MKKVIWVVILIGMIQSIGCATTGRYDMYVDHRPYRQDVTIEEFCRKQGHPVELMDGRMQYKGHPKVYYSHDDRR